MIDEQLKNDLLDLIVKSGDRIILHDAKVCKHKTGNDLLTENDLESEKFILGFIRGRYPALHVISEETEADHALGGNTVVVDPIDGTCNFAAGNDFFGVQLAYFEEKICVFSAIYLPKRKELLYAIKGQGSFLNGNRIMVDQEKRAGDGILLTSDTYPAYPIPLSRQYRYIQELQSRYLKTRLFGAACFDFASLSKGEAVSYLTFYYKIWDIAPGLLIASEAGCVYAPLEGEFFYGSQGLVVSNNTENLRVLLDTYKRTAD